MRFLLILPVLALPLALAACVERKAPPPTGAEDFASYCAGCHGATAKGDGPAAAGLSRRPADLTRISARNGGVFPGTKVMAKIWSYSGGPGAETPMPSFAPLLDGDLVGYDGGDGIASPTPVRLVQVAEYLKSLQQ
jgi:mono/diheme cytochrome c family protein